VTSREVFDGRSVVVFSVPGAFTRGMGILVDRDDLVFGQRSWRCSMLVRDGVIEKMFIDGKHIRGADELQSWLRKAAAA
jgi:peroxiredoxin